MLQVLALALAAGAALPAVAITVDYSDFPNGVNNVNLGFATFTATGGNFEQKTLNGVSGVGVSGLTSGEIDIGESIAGSFTSPVTVDSFQLAFLFDGPEFGDVNEIAKITVDVFGVGLVDYFLTVTGTTSAVWTGLGSVLNLSPAQEDSGALWAITNPFGTSLINSITFAAVAGSCGTAGGACTNQSDYSLNSLSVTPVPVPAAFGLLAVGLGLLGFTARRRGVKV
jgi:hypothetical protein